MNSLSADGCTPAAEDLPLDRGSGEIGGPDNLSSPNPSDNRTLMAELRRAVKMPLGLPLEDTVDKPDSAAGVTAE